MTTSTGFQPRLLLTSLCSDNPAGTRDRIQELAQKHEELQLNIDYLESTRAKNERELQALRQPQPKKPSNYKDEDEERNAIQLQRDITEHEAAIARLQKTLKSKDSVVCDTLSHDTDIARWSLIRRWRFTRSTSCRMK